MTALPAMRAAAPRWRALVRRFVGALALGALVVGCLEPLVAEAHDGDEPSTHADAPRAAELPADQSDSPPPAHVVHLCHCTHAHGASTLRAAEVTVVISVLEDVAAHRQLIAPSSVTLDGLLRPPAPARG